MGLFDLLFVKQKAVGRIYSMHGVGDAHRDMAEVAISENRYEVYARQPGDRAILILRTRPPLVALITREPSFSGGAPDIIIRAVYEADDDPCETAASLAEFE